MSENKFTPGPWTVQDHYVVTDRHEQLEVIAVVGGHIEEPLNFACDPADLENAANTLLMAAAPDLLEVCKAIAALADGQGRANLMQVAGMAKRVIKKAGVQ